MKFEELTPEQQEMAKACKSTEELIALAEEEGIALSDDELEGIAGGAGMWDCPFNDCAVANSPYD